MAYRIYFLLIIISNCCFADSCTFSVKKYTSEVNRAIEIIEFYRGAYEDRARSWFFYDLPPKREQWETKYHDQFKNLKAKQKYTCRYPDIYHDILLFEERIELIKNYRYESCYKSYMSPGWAYSKEEKEILISRKRAEVNKNAQHCKDYLFECLNEITEAFVEVYEGLIKGGNSPLSLYHDYGLLAYLNNNFEKSIDLLSEMIDCANEQEKIENLDSKMYHDLGAICLEAMMYNEAVDYLTEAINLDPGNKQIHFDRAVAYFETGLFDLAIDDFLKSEKSQEIAISTQASNEFTTALIASVTQGASEAIVEFVPSFCSSAYGMNRTYWTSYWKVHPLNPAALENINNFANTCYEIAESLVGYWKDFEVEIVHDYFEEIKNLYTNYEKLSEKEKGDLIGYTLGKYGVDIFAGAAAIKGAKLLKGFQNLKILNRIGNLEAMAASNANKEAIINSSLKHASQRELFFKNIKINYDAHYKHVPGHNDFIESKSIWEHKDPEGLLKRFAGTGRIERGTPGMPGYKETVDFGEHIGIWKNKEGTIQIPTTRGTIHYGKKGAHIIPANPNPLNKHIK